jgi:hypothetical protein
MNTAKNERWALINIKSGLEIKAGDEVRDFRGNPAIVHKNIGSHPTDRSTGRIAVIIDGDEMSYYPSVYNAQWVRVAATTPLEEEGWFITFGCDHKYAHGYVRFPNMAEAIARGIMTAYFGLKWCTSHPMSELPKQLEAYPSMWEVDTIRITREHPERVMLEEVSNE